MVYRRAPTPHGACRAGAAKVTAQPVWMMEIAIAAV
jgi:hypothetical protein